MPIPADRNIERLNIYENNRPIYDLFFTMSHGVNRGVLKGNKKDERDPFIEKLIQNNPNIVFDIFGYKNRQPIWSEDFYQTINQSKMGLNLSRTNSVKYYTSNRISSLIGNGLMTFVDKKTKRKSRDRNDRQAAHQHREHFGCCRPRCRSILGRLGARVACVGRLRADGRPPLLPRR